MRHGCHGVHFESSGGPQGSIFVVLAVSPGLDVGSSGDALTSIFPFFGVSWAAFWEPWGPFGVHFGQIGGLWGASGVPMPPEPPKTEFS